MAGWIEEEAYKYREFATDAISKGQIIASSQFWSQLRQQVERDAAAFNENPIWKQALGEEPLTVHDRENGVEIRKLWLPAVYVRVTNEGCDISIETEIADSVEDSTKSTEELRVVATNGRVHLKGDRGSYLVPEQASKHLFDAIVQSFRRAAIVSAAFS